MGFSIINQRPALGFFRLIQGLDKKAPNAMLLKVVLGCRRLGGEGHEINELGILSRSLWQFS